ncbi:hypothetical protein AVEN_26246-1 [Araneus ventricosus]|uniref:Uncharacterized protein n=1 Tax=Araneus ventricosus TaxID=182803 RepID=A0A4Y2ANI6_ARAVE|nr:hypothetical protein AVEN_26246-1 [Araneus ventricosus]
MESSDNDEVLKPTGKANWTDKLNCETELMLQSQQKKCVCGVNFSCILSQIFADLLTKSFALQSFRFSKRRSSGISQNRSDCSWFDVSGRRAPVLQCLLGTQDDPSTSYPLFAPPNSYFTQSIQMVFACGTVFRPRVHSSAEGESGHDRSICVFRLNPMNWLIVELRVD